MNIKRYACAIGKYLSDSNYRFLINAGFGKYNKLSDKEYLERKFECCMGKSLDLEHPQTFNEKLQWLKLYDRRPEYTIMVDKYAVKKYVSDKIGEEYIIPTLGVWDNPDDIDFDTLPDKFVLKCNHNSGLGMCICKDKSELNIEKVKSELKKGLAQDYYITGREWPYKNVPRKIIAEEYIEDKGKAVPEDYKVYCINGKPLYIVVFHNRFNDSEELSETVYNTSWQPQHISLDEHFKVSDIVEPVPECLDKMLEFAEMLSTNMSQSRIDFYIVNNRLYFGEITLYTASGFQKMIPESLDYELGKLIKLPDKKG